MITILGVGKKHDALYAAAIEMYEQRIATFTKISWILIPHSSFADDQARTEESNEIVKRIRPDVFVILLDEKGNNVTSIQHASLLEKCRNSPRDVIYIIGGAYGVDERIRKRADQIIAFGSAVFPHQLVRLMLIEQIYRAHTILSGLPYHHA